MDLTIESSIPAFSIPDSMMFCYSTGLMDMWSPAIERVQLRERSIPPFQIEIKAVSGNTGVRRTGSWKWKAYRLATGLIKGAETVDRSGQFVFDARFDTDKNLAHILDNVATRVLFAKDILSQHLQDDIEIHVVVKARASRLARTVYQQLGIPVISTDDDVCGEIVTVSTHRIPAVRPQLFDIELREYPDSSMERIFIPRRGSRGLINNEEVTSFLAERGFRVCYFEDYPLREQWSIARNAKEVVAIHGAAVSNLVFNRLGLSENGSHNGSGVKVIELMSPGWMNSGFRGLVSAVNGRWCCVRGQITPEILRTVDFTDDPPNPLKAPFNSAFKVDCQTIQMALDYLESR